MEDEIFHYGGKFGWIYQNSKHFNDKDFLGDNYLYYKIQKIKIWSGKKDSKDIINGIQVWYKNILDGKLVTPGEFKGDEGNDNVVEFEVKPNEYLTDFHIRIDTEVTQVGFETNKHNNILVGGTQGEDKIINSNGGENIIVFLYGAYDNLLHALGVGYVNKKDYMKTLFIGFFQLRHKLKKDEAFKKKCAEIESTLAESDKVLLTTCLLPDDAFKKIMKFCLF